MINVTPCYSVLSDLNYIGGEIEIRETHRAALAISTETFLIARAKVDVWGCACASSLRDV